MTVFRPWDADDDEYRQRLTVRELLPTTLRSAVLAWLGGRLNAGYGSVSPETVNSIQSALRQPFGLPTGYVSLESFLARLERLGDQFVMRVVDFVLSSFQVTSWEIPREVSALLWHLDQNMSAVAVTTAGGVYRLARRLPDGVEEVAVEAVAGTTAVSGRHLRKAWDEVRGIDPNSSSVMTEAIRAVEAVAGEVVIPKDKQPRLGKIVSALRSSEKWSLRLPKRDDNHPDQRAVLIGMLEVLAFAEQHRHSGTEPDTQVALAHVELASVLVGWFASGVVFKED